jgi:hypothetical protein
MQKIVTRYAKSYPAFVNKYNGRSNGGIPCFSEERLLQRASKRMTEMKKRVEEHQRSNLRDLQSIDVGPRNVVF